MTVAIWKSGILSDKHEKSKKEVINYFHLNSSTVSDDFLLKKIHLKRLREPLPDCCVSYLFETYMAGSDLRFFNEFLWLSQNRDRYLKALSHFKNQVNQSGFYKYCYDGHLEQCLKFEEELKTVVKDDFSDTSVGLIGTPLHFISAYFKFKGLGISTDIINVKYHKNRKFDLVLNNKLTSLIYRLIFGRKRYFEIDIVDKGELKDIILPKKYDIGFHKLTFIISESLIDQFRKGLINDHWGTLPLFKGRSTLAYSKLFGANLMVTNHLVRPEIDSGDIICFTTLNNKRIKRDIYLGLGDRVVKSVGLLASNRIIQDLDNTEGKIFYEMHPWLLNYIKKNV